jgi:hypothetical protein
MATWSGWVQEPRANGRHRVLYQPRHDPVVQMHALELGRHSARLILHGIDAVSPHQRDPDGHRLLVAAQLTQAMLSEIYRMIGGVTGTLLDQQVPGFGAAILDAADRVVRAPAPMQDLTTPPAQARRQARRTPTSAQPRNVTVPGRPSGGPPGGVHPVRQQVPRRAVVNRRGG